MQAWMDRYLFWAGAKVLVKDVAQVTPTYTMSVFKFSKELCDYIHSMSSQTTRKWSYGNTVIAMTL